MEGLFCFKSLADGFRIVADGMQGLWKTTGLWKTRRGKGMKHREKGNQRFRNSLGVCPTSFLKAVQKLCSLLKPQHDPIFFTVSRDVIK